MLVVCLKVWCNTMKICYFPWTNLGTFFCIWPGQLCVSLGLFLFIYVFQFFVGKPTAHLRCHCPAAKANDQWIYWNGTAKLIELLIKKNGTVFHSKCKHWVLGFRNIAVKNRNCTTMFFFCLSWKGVEVVCSTKVLIITINGIIYDRLMPLL